jgi:hypothetical protein
MTERDSDLPRADARERRALRARMHDYIVTERRLWIYAGFGMVAVIVAATFLVPMLA